MRTYNQQDVKWDGLRLRLCTGRLLATVEPDTQWPRMYWVHLAGGFMTADMVNLTRAKDAAIGLALAELNHHDAPSEARSVRPSLDLRSREVVAA
jgi:hypothetical protein